MSTFTFGAQPQAQTGGSSLFGNTNNASGLQPAFGDFSTPNPQQTQQGGTNLFGQPPNNTNTGGSLFGNTGGQQQQQNSTSAGGGGGLFGSQPAASGGGGLFGSTTQPPTSGTGGGGGLFGGNSGGGGLFGSTNTTQQQPTASGGLFGSTAGQNQQPSSGLFGSTTQPAPATGGSLFGKPAQTATSGGLFGNNSTTTPGGLFGQQNQQQPQQQSNSLFGSTTQPQQNSLFNSQQTGPSLGASTSQQPSLFGSTNQPMTVGSSMSGSVFGQKQEVGIEERMMGVQKAWDTNSPDCRFKYFFYNVVDPGTTGQYGRPQGANDEMKWVKAVRENPDPENMVPVLATGWADVKKRVQMQENIASVHQQRIKELSQALSHLTRQTSLSSSIRLQALQTHLQQILHRLIHLAALSPQFIPILQSTAFRQEEVVVKQQLEGVKSELEGKGKVNKGSIGMGIGNGTPRRGKGEGRMMGQLNELWGQVEEIRRRRKGRGGGGVEGWLADDKALAEVAEILAQQQMALSKLTDLINDAGSDADVMQQGLGMITSER